MAGGPLEKSCPSSLLEELDCPLLLWLLFIIDTALDNATSFLTFPKRVLLALYSSTPNVPQDLSIVFRILVHLVLDTYYETFAIRHSQSDTRSIL